MRRTPGERGDADFTDYLHARWPRLVAALVAEGVAPDAARLALAEVMLEHRRGWDRLMREEQVDLLVWDDVRRRLGLAVAAGPAPDVELSDGAADRTDDPQVWLTRAAASLRARRADRWKRQAIAAAVVVVVLAGLAWWDARPDPPAVRPAANPLPVTWYAGGELHLEDVVVELPGVAVFAEWRDGVAVRHTDGRLVLVHPDGSVDDLDEAPSVLTVDPPRAPSYDAGPEDVVVQSVPLPDGGWAHLVDSSRRAGERGEVRLSETGRRALVLCSEAGRCSPPQTVPEAGVAIRLR